MKSTFLKVMGILCVIFGIIGLAASGISLASMGALAAFGLPTGSLTGGLAISLIDGIIMLIAGIIGIAASKNPNKAGVAMVFGIIMIIIAVISIIVSAVSMAGLQSAVDEMMGSFGAESVKVGGLNFTSFTSLIIPVLYFIAALLFKKKARV